MDYFNFFFQTTSKTVLCSCFLAFVWNYDWRFTGRAEQFYHVYFISLRITSGQSYTYLQEYSERTLESTGHEKKDSIH